MIKKISIALLLMLFISSAAEAQTPKVEVFNIDKGKVEKSVTMTPVLQDEAQKSVKSMTGIFKKVSPIPKTGYLVKVPLDPAVPVKATGIDVLTSEVIIVISEEQKPILMIFDNENRAFFFEFSHDITKLKKELNL
ncbi:hypothetical protein [Metabacillus iocasae]|uniref:Group-specific protein n=1 Tax=Priestia iocasae TaxID=2291674 RepID=A0ABS2QXM9_9BACI|nr:hypothetical protein [Metabacillus iocasae]MBM7703938.1 hypothetical protein [Metabacillus iocasae]